MSTPSPRWGGLVALEQGGGPGEVLGELAVLGPAAASLSRGSPFEVLSLSTTACSNDSATRICVPASSSRACACGSRGPAGEVATVRGAGERVPVLGPHRAQHHDRSPVGVGEQSPQPGGHPLTGVAALGEQIELGLVQPDHRPGPTRSSASRAASGRVGSNGCHSRHPSSNFSPGFSAEAAA